jgi:ribosomal-protein-alanine N-acetyltransferase
MQILETQHLRLVAFSATLMNAALMDKAQLGALIGGTIPDSWPGPDLAEVLPAFVRMAEKKPSVTDWNYLIVHKADKILIGDMGFMGGPDEDNVAEVGYSIVPEYRNRGYATEALRACIRWGFQEQGMKAIIADTLQDNIASIKVLTRVGMRNLGTKDDMFKWRLDK